MVLAADYIGGWSKAAWVVFLIVQAFDDRVRAAAASEGPAAEIEKADQLLSKGSITQSEFDALKAKAIAAQ